MFPVTTDVPFPKTFTHLCRKILTRLFRVFVHVYIHHFDRIVSIGAVSVNQSKIHYRNVNCMYGTFLNSISALENIQLITDKLNLLQMLKIFAYQNEKYFQQNIR